MVDGQEATAWPADAKEIIGFLSEVDGVCDWQGNSRRLYLWISIACVIQKDNSNKMAKEKWQNKLQKKKTHMIKGTDSE